MKLVSIFLSLTICQYASRSLAEDMAAAVKVNKPADSSPLAETPAATPAEAPSPKTEVKGPVDENHSYYFGYLNYSPFDLLIPSKMGLTLGRRPDVFGTWEVEYLRGTVAPFVVDELGEMTDQRLSFIKRRHGYGSSFHFSYGISLFDFKLLLGDDLLNRLSLGSYPSVDLIHLQSIGFNLAMGNRWNLGKNFLFGVDWLSWAQPIFILKKDDAFLDYVTDPEDKDNVKTLIDVVSYFPRLAALKVQLGYQF